MMKAMKLVVRPRLHLGLISMHEGGIRKNGGIGFSVHEPCGTLAIFKSKNFCFEDQRTIPMGATEIQQLHDMVEAVSKKCAFDTRIHVTFSGNFRTHVGMGSGTVIRLGVLEGLFCANGREISRVELIQRAQRGGTSGIGINTYFSGGLVLDLGVPNNNDDFVPSSLATNPSVPLSFSSVEMPNWPLCLCVPRSIRSKTQEEEVEFFARTAPVSEIDSYRAAYEAIFGVFASALEKNYDAFCKSIYTLQETKWKLQERKEYGPILREIEIRLHEFGAAAVGMSSLGPMLYCFGEVPALDRISRESEILDCDIITTMPYNAGREFFIE